MPESNEYDEFEYDEDEEKHSPGRFARWFAFLPALSAGARLVRNIVLLIVVLGLGLFLFVKWSLRPPRALTPPGRSFVLTGVTIVNPGLDRLPGRTIIVRDGRITKITDVAPADAGVVASRYAGYFVLPGLIDMHVHTPPPPANTDRQYFYLQYLANGVTAIRDTGNSGFLLRDRINTADGAVAGPQDLHLWSVPGWRAAGLGIFAGDS